MAKKTINVQGIEITILPQQGEDYISLTDIAQKFNAEKPASLVENWIRNKDTIEFLEEWEVLYNPGFNVMQLHDIKKETGTNRFTISPTKWIQLTNATGIITKIGRHNSGTFAHSDIATNFCYWLSPKFQLYVIKEFQRLKQQEAEQQKLGMEWDVRRTLASLNYRIHTDAVKEYLVPERIQNTQLAGLHYANEADLLNHALFGRSSKSWRDANPLLKGNMRDHATIEQLTVLSNLESLNSEFIRMGLEKGDRLQRLNEVAIYQMNILVNAAAVKQLKGLGNFKGVE
jgi:KilA-N domain